MFSVGKIAGGIVAEVTGNEDLGKLVGIGVDAYMGNYAGAAEQLGGLDFGGNNLFANEPGHETYDYTPHGTDDYDDGYTAGEYLADRRVTDSMYADAKQSGDWSSVSDAEYGEEQYQSDLLADAKESGDWSGVVDYETSREEFAMYDENGNVIDDSDSADGASGEIKSEEDWESDLQETLDDTEQLLDESDELEDGVEDLAAYEQDEQTTNDALRANQRA